MRAVHLLRKYNPAEWGGTETAIQRLFAGLRGHGVDPVAYGPRAGGVGPGDPLAEAGFEVRRFRACVPIWGISREERARQTAVSGNLVSFDLAGALWRESEASVIHSHALGRLGATASLVARLRRIPFVLSIHGGLLDPPGSVKSPRPSARAAGVEWGKLVGAVLGARGLLARADAVLTCNHREEELLREAVPDKRIVVQPHGLPLSAYARDHRAAARAAFPFLCGKRVVLCAGRIDPVKNQIWLAREAPEMFRRHPDAILVLAGASTDEAYSISLRREIKRRGLEERVVLTGGLPPGDPRLTGLTQSAEALVVPSLSETFALVILEAWACGAMVVSSRTSGALDRLDHGANGWLFDLADPEGFHQGVDLAFTQSGLKARLVAAGARTVREDYDCSELAGRVKKLYETLIEEKNALCNLAG